MCGRVTFSSSIEEVSKAFDAKFGMEQVGLARASYNIGPKQRLCVINSEGGERVGRIMNWGLIPSWVRRLEDFKATTINARADRILESKVYRGPFKKKRCIVVVNGFYEWKDEGKKKKQPYYFKPAEGQFLGMAGLWESTNINTDNGEVVEHESCTIITTEPNEVMAEYHDRMPVILMPKDYDTWMSPDTSEKELLSLLKPCPPDFLEIIKVSDRVGNVRNDSPENIIPIEDQEDLAF